jgi:hypothetical protein
MKTAGIIITALIVLPGSALAASAFDGTWKVNMDHIQLPTTPDVHVIDATTYTCSSCVPAYTVKADGTDQKVAGHDFDTLAVTLTPTTLSTQTKLKGKLLSDTKTMLGADGKTATFESTEYNGAKPTVVKGASKQVAPGAPGSHPLSGSWIDTKIESLSDAAATATIAMTEDGFSLKSNGLSYDAKFDGKRVPIAGDLTGGKVSVKKISATEVVESDYDLGKLDAILHMTVSADGKKIHVVQQQVKTHGVTRYTLDKQ